MVSEPEELTDLGNEVLSAYKNSWTYEMVCWRAEVPARGNLWCNRMDFGMLEIYFILDSNAIHDAWRSCGRIVYH